MCLKLKYSKSIHRLFLATAFKLHALFFKATVELSQNLHKTADSILEYNSDVHTAAKISNTIITHLCL
jgi:hypothetical protein